MAFNNDLDNEAATVTIWYDQRHYGVVTAILSFFQLVYREKDSPKKLTFKIYSKASYVFSAIHLLYEISSGTAGFE